MLITKPPFCPALLIRGVLLVLASALAILTGAGKIRAEEGNGRTSYRIEARVDVEASEIRGAASIRFANPSAQPLDKIYLVAYPNTFLKPSRHLNDINYEWIYPGSFKPGWMEIDSLTLDGGIPRTLEISFENREKRPENTLVRVSVNPPLEPGESVRLHAAFRTKVPEKFGPLGCVDDLLTANGGWYPYLPAFHPRDGWLPKAPPPFADLECNLRIGEDREAVINGIHVKPKNGEVSYKAEGQNLLTVVVAERFWGYTSTVGKVRFQYYRADEDEDFGERVVKTARSVLKWFHKAVGRPPPARVSLVESRIRSVLTLHGGGVSLVSDRILRVLPYPVDLRKYHLREVAFEILYQLFLPSVALEEDGRDYNWVCEGSAWLSLRQYLRDRQVDFDEVLDLLNVFSFIPIIDQTLVAPRFPFNDVFFDTFFKNEVHRESVFRFSNRTAFGRIVMEKLKDVLPRSDASRILHRYVLRPEGGRLRGVVEKLRGEDMSWFWSQWRRSYPKVNYAVGEVESETLGPGRHRVTVEIERSGGRPGFREYVDLGVILDNGKKYAGRILVDRDRIRDSFIYPDSLDKVILDPRGRCRETNKTDNKSTRSIKFLITSFRPRLEISPDFSNLSKTRAALDIWGGFASVLEGDYSNQVFLNYFYQSRGFGFDLGYSRALGFKIDRTDFPQAIGAFVFFQRLDRSFARPEEPSPEDGDDSRLIAASLRLFYTVDTRIDRANPHSGMAFTATAEFADKILGTDFRFMAFSFSFRWLFSPARHHIIASQVRFGTSTGEMPRQRLFALGGYSGLRGYRDNDYLGEHQLILRVEYRHMLLNELDINFFWIGYIRRLGGSLFLEVGSVTDRFRDLFRHDVYRSSIGYGVKISFDSFGVRPFIVGMDFAVRLDDSDITPEFYFTVGQSF